VKRLNLIFIALTCLFLTSYGYSSPVILRDVAGHKIPFDSLKGKWVIINYWASWCPSCVDEIGELNRFYHNKKDKVILFAVNYDMLPIAIQRELIKKYKISYPSLQYDPSFQLRLGQIRGLPATFIFNPQGKLSKTLYGGQTSFSLNRALS
jgi:thiol-disulfide isomerase/thioredoxin